MLTENDLTTVGDDHNLFNDSHNGLSSSLLSDASSSFETITTELPINSEHLRRKRSATGANHNNYDEYTVEVLVAVDRKMQEKHGDSIQEYVLTLMSTVRFAFYIDILCTPLSDH